MARRSESNNSLSLHSKRKWRHVEVFVGCHVTNGLVSDTQTRSGNIVAVQSSVNLDCTYLLVCQCILTYGDFRSRGRTDRFEAEARSINAFVVNGEVLAVIRLFILGRFVSAAHHRSVGLPRSRKVCQDDSLKSQTYTPGLIRRSVDEVSTSNLKSGESPTEKCPNQ